MIKSLRWRLQIWYAGLLLAVVGGFGSILYFQAQASKFHEIDRQLEASALYLDASLRGLPPHFLDGMEQPWGKEPKEPWGKEPREPWGKDPKEPREPKGPPRPKEKKDFKGPPPKTPEQRLAELALPTELEGRPGLPDAERTYFAVWRGDGLVLKSSLPLDQLPWQPGDEAFGPRMVIEERGDYREAWMRGPRQTRIVVGRTVARELADLHAFAWQLIGIGAGVLVVGMAGGYWLAARIFRPIAAMSAAAEAMNAANLSARIETAAVDVELAGLAHVLNAMFGRLEAAFERQQQFTADASHELRTPLAILRANAELALSQARSPEEYRHTIESCLRAADRMTSLVGGLLQLARADAGNPGLRRQPVAFDHVVTDCLTLVKPLAEKKKIALTAELAPALVAGDADSLAQLVDNLLSNAIKHNRVGGNIHVKLTAADSSAILSVADTGIGIPEKDRPRIFERFFRVDKARARASGGTGLGLAICKAIVDAHAGTIDFESGETTGTTFRVELPTSRHDG